MSYLINEFCYSRETTECTDNEISSHHTYHTTVGSMLLEEYITLDSQCDNDAVLNSNSKLHVLVTRMCIEKLWCPNSCYSNESIIYFKLSAHLISYRAIRSALSDDLRHNLLLGLFHLATQQFDPTNFLFETLNALSNLVYEHPAIMVSALLRLGVVAKYMLC